MKIIKFVFLIISFVLSDGHTSNDLNHQNDQKPNILLINIDDLGWTDLSFMGSQFYETPNVDQLANEGMIFSRAYSAASNCNPSRAALFSGQYAPRTGVYTVRHSDRGEAKQRKLIPIENTLFLDEKNVTISELLQQNGYMTAHVGKWHISKDPTAYGMDINIAGLEVGAPNYLIGEHTSAPNDVKGGVRMGGYFSPYNNPHLEDGPEGEYLTDRLTDEAIAFMETVKGQPFFLNYAPYVVHTPIEPKPELEKKYNNKSATDRHFNPGYAAMVETMDTNVGRLMDYLKESGKFENTLIIFTSDNGSHSVSRQLPLRAGKGTYFEGGIRVPLIAIWKGNIEPGSFSREVVSNIDFYPTFLEAAEIEQPRDKILDGKSLVPIFKGESLQQRSLFWHFPIYLQGSYSDSHDTYFRTRPGSVILEYPWKLHEYFEDGRLELYNLELDIREQTNLVDIFPEKAQILHASLKRWREKLNAPIPKELNPEFKNYP